MILVSRDYVQFFEQLLKKNILLPTFGDKISIWMHKGFVLDNYLTKTQIVYAFEVLMDNWLLLYFFHKHLSKYFFISTGNVSFLKHDCPCFNQISNAIQQFWNLLTGTLMALMYCPRFFTDDVRYKTYLSTVKEQ